MNRNTHFLSLTNLDHSPKSPEANEQYRAAQIRVFNEKNWGCPFDIAALDEKSPSELEALAREFARIRILDSKR